MHWEKIEIKVKRQEPIPGKSPGRKGGKHGPGRKWGHTLNAVNYGRQVYVFGGYGKDERQTNDVYVYNTTKDAWSKPNIKGTPPSPRDSHTSTVVGSRLFVFGGTDGSSGLNDLYMLDTSTNTWTRLAAQGDVPAAREGHAAARVEGLVYVFGGCGKAGEGGTVDETYYNDVHVFNPDTMRWARVATTGTAPSPRDSHSCCAWGNQLIVFGGEDSRNCYLSDVFVLDTSSLMWREVRARGQKPLPRAGHVAVTAGRYMVVFGGFTDERRLFNDLHVLDLSSEHWQQYTPTGDVPSRRFSLSADLLDTVSGKMMLFGGCNDDLEALEDAYFLHTVSGKMMLFGGCNNDLEALEDAYFLHTGRRERFLSTLTWWPASLPPFAPPTLSPPSSPRCPDFGSHAVEFPRPRVRRRSFDSMPMPMDARMGMDAGVGMGGGATPMGMRGKRGESGEGAWRWGAEGVYEAGGMDEDDDGYRPPARRMRVPQVSPALPPGLHPADLIAPAGREVPFEAQIVDVFHLGYCLRATVAGRPLHGLLFSYDPSFAQAAFARQAQRQAGTRSSRQPPPPPPHLTFSLETGTHTITVPDPHRRRTSAAAAATAAAASATAAGANTAAAGGAVGGAVGDGALTVVTSHDGTVTGAVTSLAVTPPTAATVSPADEGSRGGAAAGGVGEVVATRGDVAGGGGAGVAAGASREAVATATPARVASTPAAPAATVTAALAEAVGAEMPPPAAAATVGNGGAGAHNSQQNNVVVARGPQDGPAGNQGHRESGGQGGAEKVQAMANGGLARMDIDVGGEAGEGKEEEEDVDIV
ncbi:unnamed protein product [Closterium sp. NIES-53]